MSFYRFKHFIGKSTLEYGFTIPQSACEYIRPPLKGKKRTIKILLNDHSYDVVLRTLNNSQGHCQVRYEGADGNALQSTIRSLFGNSKGEIVKGEYLDIEIASPDMLRITPYPYKRDEFLVVKDLICHHIKEAVLIENRLYGEVVEAMQSVRCFKTERQMYYNQVIRKEFARLGWEKEQRVVRDNNITLKCDFRKDDMQIEVEFGNARGYYQDLIKFWMSKKYNNINIGGLIIPSVNFAHHLCMLGKKQAVQKSNNENKTYSGMTDFEKVQREFDYIKDLFNMPLYIMAVDIKT